MDYQCSNLFLMQHLSSISHQKIYPTVPIKIEMPLWKTLHITRLWNHAREQEIYLSQQQQQQKNDWWIHQMAGSHQSLENYLPPSWLDDTASTTTPTIDTTASELSTTTCQLEPYHHDSTTNASAIDLVHDDDDDDDEEEEDEDADTMIKTTQTDTTTTDQAHATVENLMTQDELAPLLGVSTQDRKRKHEGDPDVSESSPTPPPATRATTTTTAAAAAAPSSPMLKV